MKTKVIGGPAVKRQTKVSVRKIFVLDTSVILYDHDAIKNFEEHDVAIPIHVLEELDNFKKGNETVNFEAREFIRFIDKIAKDKLINNWIPLNGSTKGNFKVLMHDRQIVTDAEVIYGDRKNDHKILNTVLTLKQANPDRKVVLVTKDICLRLKAKALNIPAEDYETGKIKNVKELSTGQKILKDISPDLIDELFEKGSIDPAKLLSGHNSVSPDDLTENNYLLIKVNRKSVLAYHNPITRMIERVEKQTVYNIKARNSEQTFAIHALMNPNIKLVTMQGMAGTGKTLLALASAMEQRRDYRQIFVTCPIIPLSNKDIGYLPGDIKSKLDPYMEPIWDNLKFIKEQFEKNEKERKRIDAMVETEKIAIAPLAYIRGRSLSKIFFIVDEAQNLTPHEVKTIISRAGDDTKIVFMGDIHQIDTPYLDAQSNGLSYLIDKVKTHPLFAHITLEKGERSELANLANELL